MSNKRELNAFNKFIWNNSKKFCKNFFNNVRPIGLKNLYHSKYEKWVYVGSIPIVGTYYLTQTNFSLVSDLLLTSSSYFIRHAVRLLPSGRRYKADYVSLF